MNYKHTMHLLHFLLTLFFLPWGLVWLWRTLANSSHNREVELHFAKEQLEEIKRINRSA